MYFLQISVSPDRNILTGLFVSKGPQGPPGLRGVVGREGFEGLPGIDGLYGKDGTKGVKVNGLKIVSQVYLSKER